MALYDEDYYSWTQEQADLLRRRAANQIDWDALAEEVEDLGRSQRHALESALVLVIEHLLKLDLSPAEEPRAGWRRSVAVHRDRAKRQLRDSPGLRGQIDMADLHRTGREVAAKALLAHREDEAAANLPHEPPYTLDRLLEDGFYGDRP